MNMYYNIREDGFTLAALIHCDRLTEPKNHPTQWITFIVPKTHQLGNDDFGFCILLRVQLYHH